MTILVLAEHDGNDLKPGTLTTVTAATKIGGDIHILVMGSGVDKIAGEVATIDGVSKVIYANSESFAHHLPEVLAPFVAGMADNYSHILAPSTTFGKNLLPRIAAIKDVQQISDISEVVSADTFKRPVYAGNAIATVQSGDKLKLITVRGSNFDAAAKGSNTASVETVTGGTASDLVKFLSQELTKSERPDLTAARVVISGGRGVGSKENFHVIETLADKIGAAVGASRAAVDSGYAPNDYQVGQTGKIVAPDLYVALGISGAIQHLAGMKDSKVIVAINKDPEAPIFQVADYGLVADLFQAAPEMTEKL